MGLVKTKSQRPVKAERLVFVWFACTNVVWQHRVCHSAAIDVPRHFIHQVSRLPRDNV